MENSHKVIMRESLATQTINFFAKLLKICIHLSEIEEIIRFESPH